MKYLRIDAYISYFVGIHKYLHTYMHTPIPFDGILLLQNFLICDYHIFTLVTCDNYYYFNNKMNEIKICVCIYVEIKNNRKGCA